MQKIIVVGAASLLLVACGGPAHIQETATSIPQRDLTLTPSATETQIASRIELAALPTTHRSKPTRPAARVRLAAAKTPVAAPAPAPVPEAAAPAPAPSPAAEASPVAANSHELAPGTTVTMIPVSTASDNPSSAGGGWSEIPSPRPGGGVTIRGWPGGHCGSGGSRGPVSILE